MESFFSEILESVEVFTKPPKIFGVKRAIYTLEDGDKILVSHSKYSEAMRRGSTLGGQSVVMWSKKEDFRDGEPNWISPSFERKFRVLNHVDDATKFLKRRFNIDHDPSQLKEFKG